MGHTVKYVVPTRAPFDAIVFLKSHRIAERAWTFLLALKVTGL